MNWGGFAGGFSQGLNSGLSMGQKINDLIRLDKVEKVRTQALAEADAKRESEINSTIQDNSGGNPAATMGVTGHPAATNQAPSTTPKMLPVAEDAMTADQPSAAKPIAPQDEDRPITRRRVLAEQPSITPNTKPATATAAPVAAQAGLPFVVGGKGYATRQEARAAAEKAVPDKMHFFAKTAIPRIQEKMIELGDIDAADKLGKWAEDRENQEYARNWMKLDLATRSGDFKNAAKQFVSLYKKFDDGVELVGDPEEIKSEGGDITGFKVNLKNTEGKEYSMVVTPQDILTRGAAMLSPIEKFKLDYAKQQSADEAVAKGKAEMAKEERALLVDNYKAERNNRYQSQRDVRQQGDAIERMTLQQQLEEAGASQRVQREVGAKVDLLRSAGRSEQFINEVLPELLGVGSYKKALSPEDAKLKIRGELMANDRDFQRMTEAQRQTQVNEVMKFVYGGTATPRAQGTTTTPQGSPPVWRQ